MSIYFVEARVPNPQYEEEMAQLGYADEHSTVITNHDSFDDAMRRFSELEYEVERVSVQTMNGAIIVQGGLS